VPSRLEPAGGKAWFLLPGRRAPGWGKKPTMPFCSQILFGPLAIFPVATRSNCSSVPCAEQRSGATIEVGRWPPWPGQSAPPAPEDTPPRIPPTAEPGSPIARPSTFLAAQVITRHFQIHSRFEKATLSQRRWLLEKPSAAGHKCERVGNANPGANDQESGAHSSPCLKCQRLVRRIADPLSPHHLPSAVRV